MRQAAEVDMTSTPIPARANGARSSGDGNTWREPVPMMTTSGLCSQSRLIVVTLKSSGPRSSKSVAFASGPTITVPVIVASFTMTNPAPYAVIRCRLVAGSECSFMWIPRMTGAQWNRRRFGLPNARNDSARPPYTPQRRSSSPRYTPSRVFHLGRQDSKGSGQEASVGSHGGQLASCVYVSER